MKNSPYLLLFLSVLCLKAWARNMASLLNAVALLDAAFAFGLCQLL